MAREYLTTNLHRREPYFGQIFYSEQFGSKIESQVSQVQLVLEVIAMARNLDGILTPNNDKNLFHNSKQYARKFSINITTPRYELNCV